MNRAKSILIIGGSGTIGTHLALAFRDSYKVYCTYRRHRVPIQGVTHFPVDVENRDWAKHVVYVAQPDAVIYCAGSNSFDSGEAGAPAAERIHAAGAATIATVADIFQPTFIYLSNSYVFEGLEGNYHETDTAVPSNSLGKAKLGGENFIKSRTLNYVVIRSAPLLARGNGHNISYIDRLRMTLDRGASVEVADDEIHNFASVHGLIDLIRKVIEMSAKKKIFHYGGLTKATHYEMAKLFAQKVGYDPRLIVPMRSATRSSSRLSRPNSGTAEDYSLNFSQTIETLKIKPLFLEESLDLINQNLISGS